MSFNATREKKILAKISEFTVLFIMHKLMKFCSYNICVKSLYKHACTVHAIYWCQMPKILPVADSVW